MSNETIREIKLRGFKAPLKNGTNDYPQSSNPNAPRFFFNYLGCASRGGGKTFLATKMIREFEQTHLKDKKGITHPLRTFIISPTLNANKIFDNLESLSQDDTYEVYSDDNLKAIMDDIMTTKDEVLEYKLYKEAYDLVKRTPEKKIPELMRKNPDILDILKAKDFIDPSEIEVRYKEIPVNLIVLDDCVGSSAFSRKSQNLLVYWLIRNRHAWASFILLSQSIKAIPRTIRMNCNVFMLGKFASKKVILQDLYEEVSNVLTIEQFEELYDYATKDKPYDSLIIDCSDQKKRFYRNYETELAFVDGSVAEDLKK